MTARRRFGSSCATATEYACESLGDECPTDPIKNAPGECGCGTADSDTDGDGTPDCKDQCPSDPTAVMPGDCGCAGAPAPSGTPCDDGVCAANTQCDGAGTCGNPQHCAPETGCAVHYFRGTPYWFCGNDTTWTSARALCQSVGMDLAHVESAQENAFIRSHVAEASYIGATDSSAEGDWRWVASQVQFWQGDENGGSVAGQHSSWENGEPDSSSAAEDDCAEINTDGDWNTENCTEQTEAYVCERVLPTPFVNCVSKINANHVVALFGYENPLPVQAVVPLGPENRLVPASTVPGVVPPTSFAPGRTEIGFWVPFDGPSVTWELHGQAVTATLTSPACSSASYPTIPGVPGLDPEGHGQVAGDRPKLHPFSSGTSVARTSGTGTIQQGLAPGFVAPPFRLVFTACSVDSDACLGPGSPYVKVKIGDGPWQEQNCPVSPCDLFGGCPVFQDGSVSMDDTSVAVAIELWERDDTFCGGTDDFLLELGFDVNNSTGEFTGTHSGVGGITLTGPDDSLLGFEFEHIGLPDLSHSVKLCAGWNADFVDQGFGEDFTGALVPPGSRRFFPASFAVFGANVEGPLESTTAPVFACRPTPSGSTPRERGRSLPTIREKRR